MARYYWASALAMRYSRVPGINEATDDPDTYAELPGLRTGGTATVQAPMVGRYYTHEGVEAYPVEADREFGARIAELDSSWLKYLSSAAITSGASRRPVATPTTGFSPMGHRACTPAFLASDDMLF